MRIAWQSEHHRFVLEVVYEEHEFAKTAGFKWDPHHQIWYTANSFVVSSLRGSKPASGLFISREALKQIEEAEQRAEKMLNLSKATTCDLSIPAPSGLQYLPYQKAGIAYALRIFGDLD